MITSFCNMYLIHFGPAAVVICYQLVLIDISHDPSRWEIILTRWSFRGIMTRLLNKIMSLQCLDPHVVGDILVEPHDHVGWLYPMLWGNEHPTAQMALVVYHFADLMLQSSQISSNFWTPSWIFGGIRSQPTISKTGMYTKRHCAYGLDPACSNKFDIVIGSAIIDQLCM